MISPHCNDTQCDVIKQSLGMGLCFATYTYSFLNNFVRLLSNYIKKCHFGEYSTNPIPEPISVHNILKCVYSNVSAPT